MTHFFSVSFLLVLWGFNNKVECSLQSALNGINLKCLPREDPGVFNIQRNESGFITEISGILPEVTNWLSLKYNFTYTILQENVIHTEDSLLFGRGFVSFIQSGEADVILAGNPTIATRLKFVDYTTPWTDRPLVLLIPFPEASNNLMAIIKPFEWKVWLLFIISIPVISLTLYGLGRVAKKMYNLRANGFEEIERVLDYVTNVVFSQGGYCPHRKMAIRLAAGTWCLACFVLVTAYSSVLVSYIIAPNLKPIIDSANDIPKVPGLKIVIEKGSTLGSLFLTAHNGLYKYFGDQLRADPSLCCNTKKDCIDLVLSGNKVYPNFITNLADDINEAHRTSGQCNTFLIAKKPLQTPRLSLMLRKNSPFTDLISLGILELKENGLIMHWEKKFNPQPDRCLGDINKVLRNHRISLDNLSGAFVVLLMGYAFAFFVFIVEKIIYYHKKNQIGLRFVKINSKLLSGAFKWKSRP